MRDPKEVITLEILKEEIEKVLLLKDKGVVDMLVSAVIGNKLNSDPIWLFLVASSSGGKTELINMLDKLNFVYPITDLTVNTFMSGMKKSGKETSLLLKINSGIITFKDFTSILGKNRETRAELLKQLRDIYDGKYDKATGTGQDLSWRGKIGSIAGATEVIYRHLEDFSAMGDRFIMYCVEQPPRKEVTERAMSNSNNMAEFRNHLQDCFKNLVEHVLSHLELDKSEVELDEDTKRDLREAADFAALARSAVMTDFKTGLVNFVPSPEMPMRIANQLYAIARGRTAIKRATLPESSSKALSDFEKLTLYKAAFDSIPKTRRMVLTLLGTYQMGVTSAGVATALGLPTPSVGKYLAEVNALGLCSRVKRGGIHGDEWHLKEEYQALLIKFMNLKAVPELLTSTDSEPSGDEWGALDKYNKEQVSLDSPLTPEANLF